jgi:branched-chain amino acid transport system ATP-binding protein
MLLLDNISAEYGNIKALRGVSLSVKQGAMVAIVGPNGAGKTTMFKVISGVVAPSSGKIVYEGQDLLSTKPSARASLGIAHVPEGRQVFKSMTVKENLELGTMVVKSSAQRKAALQRVLEFFPVLAERQSQLAGTLSGGQQQMLAIGRALASEPKLLLLDEPSMGLSPVMAERLFEQIEALHRNGGLTIVLVEQRVAEALQSCDWGYILDTGTIALEGEPGQLIRSSQVRQAYLGL